MREEKGVWLCQRMMVRLQHNEKEADYCAESSGGCQSAANSAGMQCRPQLLGKVFFSPHFDFGCLCKRATFNRKQWLRDRFAIFFFLSLFSLSVSPAFFKQEEQSRLHSEK